MSKVWLYISKLLVIQHLKYGSILRLETVLRGCTNKYFSDKMEVFLSVLLSERQPLLGDCSAVAEGSIVSPRWKNKQ